VKRAVLFGVVSCWRPSRRSLCNFDTPQRRRVIAKEKYQVKGPNAVSSPRQGPGVDPGFADRHGGHGESDGHRCAAWKALESAGMPGPSNGSCALTPTADLAGRAFGATNRVKWPRPRAACGRRGIVGKASGWVTVQPLRATLWLTHETQMTRSLSRGLHVDLRTGSTPGPCLW